MTEKTEKVAILNTSVRQDQRDMLIQHAKDNGFISLSEALRSILDEWKHDRERDYERAIAGRAQPIA